MINLNKVISTSLALTIIIVLAVAVGVIVWQYVLILGTWPSGFSPTPSEEPTPPEKTDKYGIFGDDEFDTIVSGYLEIKEEKGYSEGYEQYYERTSAYFVITKFYNDEFRESIEKGINSGNTVNIKEDGMYKLNLGCFEDGKITGIEYEENEVYIDEDTTKEIINSSEDKPVTIILSFGEHLGRGCTCCNLAHKVRIYEEETSD